MPADADLRAQIVAAARGYVGTPYTHQGMSEARLDCRGLPLRVGRELNLLAASAEINNYGRQPNPARLRDLLAQYLLPIALQDLQDGDVLLLRMPRDPRHLGIRASMQSGGESWPTLIHADNVQGRVVEQRLDARMQALIDSVWAFPELVL